MQTFSSTSIMRFPLSLRVQKAVNIARDIRELTLVDPTGVPLPNWTPGAHLDLMLPSGIIRSYSMCGIPGEGEYRIAVLYERSGRGASREIHESELVGTSVQASIPRNQFELVDAARYLFIAGGIGITPLLTMVRAVASKNVPWHLCYLGRARDKMAFLDELLSLAERSGGALDIVARDERDRLEVSTVLALAKPGGALYCCGPDSLIRDVQAACTHNTLDLHVERFTRPMVDDVLERPKASDTEFFAACDPNGAFEVELRRTGEMLEIAPGMSILECVRQVRTGLSFSCADGYCGTCETAVVAGIPDHRDTVLSDEEKLENRTMMICVGRSRTRRLVLDL